MNLGIVVTEVNYAPYATQLLLQALDKGWSVRCFLTENGVNMIKDGAFVGMARNEHTHLSVCEHSVERYCHDVDLKELEDVVIVGGQYQDAELVRNCDQVLVF